MASGLAFGLYSSALVLSDVAAIHVNGNSAITMNATRGSHNPKSRLRQVSSPTIDQSLRTYRVSRTSRSPSTGTMLRATAEPSPICPAPMLRL